MKIFLAMPYSQFTDKNYVIMPQFRKLFEHLLSELESHGHTCYLAARRENWGKSYEDEKASTKTDYDAIVACDLVLMVPGIPFSGGTHVEAGWASAHRKKINMFLQKNEFYSPMITGLNALTDVKYFFYNKFDKDLIETMVSSVHEKPGKKRS